MSKEIKDMIDFLNYHTEMYDKGTPLISDKEWDCVYFDLVELEKKTGIVLPNSPTQKISYTIVDKLEKVEHTVPMLSLAKTKNSIEFFLYGGGSEWLVSLKLDGLSLRLTYEGGNLKRAETRGDGFIGNDVTHLIPAFVNVPVKIPYMDTFEIDGECIITKSDFEKIKGEYKNPRNLAAGSMSLLDPADAKGRNLRFIAWKVITPIANEYSRRLHLAEELGFDIVPYMIVDRDILDYIIPDLCEIADKMSYPIDGLVGTFDDISFGESLGNTAHHPRHSLAYKFYDEEYETELIDIEWTMGRTGVLTPVAIYEDIDADGTTLNRASLHNVSVMEDLLHTPFKGQKIKIFKANAIIPQVSWGEDISDEIPIAIPDICPVCGGVAEVQESKDGVLNLVCANPNCEGKLLNKLDHFVGKKGFDVKGLSKATIEKLMDWGWLNNFSDIYKLHTHKLEWQRMAGFGEKSVEKILDAIKGSRNCTFESVISAFGIPLIGRTVAKDLTKRFKNYAEFRKAIEDDFDFTQFDGYGYEMNKALLDFDYTEMDNIVWSYLNIEYPEADSDSESLKGLVFVITGKLSRKRDEIKAEIEAAGGKVTGSVSAKTSYLICNDKNSTTGKSRDAKNLNIPIITEEEYIQKFKNI